MNTSPIPGDRKRPITRQLPRPLAVVLLLGTFVAAPSEAATIRLKTIFASRAQVQPFIDALYKFDEDTESNRGKPLKDAGERLRQLDVLAAGAKQEMRQLASRLKVAGETEAFNEFAIARARDLGLSSIVSELQAGGGAYGVLTRMDSLIALELSNRRKSAGSSTSRIFDLFNVKEAHAGFACSVAIFVLTVGQGTEANWRLCQGGARYR